MHTSVPVWHVPTLLPHEPRFDRSSSIRPSQSSSLPSQISGPVGTQPPPSPLPPPSSPPPPSPLLPSPIFASPFSQLRQYSLILQPVVAMVAAIRIASAARQTTTRL